MRGSIWILAPKAATRDVAIPFNSFAMAGQLSDIVLRGGQISRATFIVVVGRLFLGALRFGKTLSGPLPRNPEEPDAAVHEHTGNPCHRGG